MKILKLIIFLFIEAIIIKQSLHTTLDQITGWLFGINFTLAFFSINLTLFGYQLSKYKPIYYNLTKRQWFNIIVVMTLPFIPLIIFLFKPSLFGVIALILMPLILYSSIDNALLTHRYLSPNYYLKKNFSEKQILKYLEILCKKINIEVLEHKQLLKKTKPFQIPAHEYHYLPTIRGLTDGDLWDMLFVMIKLSLENNDYSVFKKSLDKLFLLEHRAYIYCNNTEKKEINLEYGLVDISHERLKSIMKWVVSVDKEGIYVESIISKLCEFLISPECLKAPLDTLAVHTATDLTQLGNTLIPEGNDQSSQKILKTLHSLIEFTIQFYSSERANGKDVYIDEYNLALYVSQIASLGKTSIKVRNIHLLYRIMETLSYLGCNAVKFKSKQIVIACLENLVQLGRESRHAQLSCYWHHCIVAMHYHAEEFMGHILTWLIKYKGKDKRFFLQGAVEEAYSRIRGVECTIKPNPKFNPKFWIQEKHDKNGHKISHVITMSDHLGYSGTLDYSNPDDLTEFYIIDI